jgi:hypothetical protein
VRKVCPDDNQRRYASEEVHIRGGAYQKRYIRRWVGRRYVE